MLNNKIGLSSFNPTSEVELEFADLFDLKNKFNIINYFKTTINGFQLQEIVEFGDKNCLPALNLIRSTKQYLTTEVTISYSCF